MKYLIIVCILPITLCAQESKHDLRAIWNDHSLEDTSRLKAFNKLVQYYYLFSDPDSALILTKKAYKFSKENKLKKYTADAQNFRGTSFFNKGEIDSAITYYQKSYEICKTLKDQTRIAILLNNIGNAYLQKVDYIRALDNYYKALEIKESSLNKEYAGMTYGNIGLIYFDLGDYKKALSYQNKALIIFEESGNKRASALAYNNIGNIYKARNERNTSMTYLKKALKIFEDIQNNMGTAGTSINIASVLMENEEYDLALTYLQKAEKIAEEGDFKLELVKALSEIGVLHSKKNNYNKAYSYSSRALALAQEVGDVSTISNSSEILWEIYKESGEYKKALEMHELHIMYRDSSDTEAFRRELAIKDFQKKQKLDKAKAKQQLLKEKNRRLKEEKVKQIWIFVFSIFIVGFILMYYLKKRKDKNERKLLLREIEILQENLASKSFIANTAKKEREIKLNRSAIECKLEIKLNETQWNILSKLVEVPTINNKELADQISLSYEGVRSSLKKLYFLFDLRKDSGKNMRMELIILALRHSQEENC